MIRLISITELTLQVEPQTMSSQAQAWEIDLFHRLDSVLEFRLNLGVSINFLKKDRNEFLP